MATVTGYTAQRMKKIEDETVVGGNVVVDELILVTRSGTTIPAGNVRGPQGIPGPAAAGSTLPYTPGPGMSAINLQDAVDELASEKVDKTALTAMFPPGSLTMYAGISVIPDGWLLCDGSEVSRTTYTELFQAIGTSQGMGNGSTTFNLPNLKGRIPVGVDPGQSEFSTIGKTGGSKTHILTAAQMPAHNHGGGTDIQNQNHRHHMQGYSSDPAGSPSIFGLGMMAGHDTGTPWVTGGVDANHAHVIGFEGGNQPHNILQPFLAIRFLVKI